MAEKTPGSATFGGRVLWGLVQAFLAAGFYFSAGLVAERAGPWTWAVYLLAVLLFVLTAASYLEGTSLHQERGGATVLARYAFNELWSFVAGWAILLDYVLLIAITAFAGTSYLSVFWEPLGTGASGVLAAAVVIVAVALLNLRGLDPLRFARSFLVAFLDVGVQLMLVVVGLVLLFDPAVLTRGAARAADVSGTDLAYAFGLAAVAFTALDAGAGFAGQVRVSRRGLKRLLGGWTATMLVAYGGLALIVSSVASAPGGPAGRLDAPLIGVVSTVEQPTLRAVLEVVLAISAALVLFTACLAAMLGLSRLGYSLAVNRQIPSVIGRLHRRYRTPWVLITCGALLAILLVVPENLEFLAASYAFGAMLAFTLVHASVLVLRRKERELDRPFRIPLNITIGGIDYPLPALLGMLLCAATVVSLVVLHESTRLIGPAWMAIGLVLYVAYRRGRGLTRRLTVPEEALTHHAFEVEYGTILVPVMGTAYDDDIMQTAGRLAADRAEEDIPGGAQVEAMWVTEVPLSLPLDARLPEGDLERARAALARAKAIGEEYEGVTVNPFTVRARSAGGAIVKEAKRRGVEAIVMPADPPHEIAGGPLLGGREALRSPLVSETTRVVLTKATCRVVLTAPGRPEASAATAALHAERPGAPPPRRDPTRLPTGLHDIVERE